MDDHFLELLKEIRYTARNKKLKDFSFKEISANTGIPVGGAQNLCEQP